LAKIRNTVEAGWQSLERESRHNSNGRAEASKGDHARRKARKELAAPLPAPSCAKFEVFQRNGA